MKAVPSLRRAWLTPLMLLFSYSGSGPAWFAAAGVLMVLYRVGFGGIPRLQDLLGAMLGAFLSLLLGQALKRVARRPRPYKAQPGLEALGYRPGDYSMPSTHASTATALALGLALCAHPLCLLVAPWSLLVIFSRYYLALHYPGDLAVGALLGLALGLRDWTDLVRYLLG